MNAQRRKEMKRLSLKRELRQAKWRFWQAEEEYVQWLIRSVRLPLTNKKWRKWEDRKNIAKREMVACEEEVKIAQYDWDHWKKLQERVLKKKGKKKKRVKLLRR